MDLDIVGGGSYLWISNTLLDATKRCSSRSQKWLIVGDMAGVARQFCGRIGATKGTASSSNMSGYHLLVRDVNGRKFNFELRC
jgi:hypothetical protein